MQKKIQLPKVHVGPDEAAQRLIDENDVEGHRLPSDTQLESLSRRLPSTGGEVFDEDDLGPDGTARR